MNMRRSRGNSEQSDPHQRRNGEFQAAVLRRLDVLVGLLMRGSDGKQIAMADRIRLLQELGATRSDIGAIVHKGSNYIGAVLGKKED